MGTNRNVVREGFLLKAEPLERESTVCGGTIGHHPLWDRCPKVRSCFTMRHDIQHDTNNMIFPRGRIVDHVPRQRKLLSR